MRNFRRILALGLALIMIVALACACGKSSKDESQGSAADGGQISADVNDGTGKVLRVAMECAYAPYNWTQTDDSNGAVKITDSADYAYGYDVMMAKYIAETLGMELEIYKLDWDSLPMAVQAGTVDCVIAGQSITSERLEMIDFSNPYYYASIVTLTKKDSKFANATCLDDFKGAKATSQINTVWYDTCIPQIPDVEILAASESAPQMLVQLEAGAADIVVTDEPTAMGAVDTYDDMVIVDLTNSNGNFRVSDEEVNIGISMMKGNTGLCEAINGVLATLTVEDFTAWMNQAISVQPRNN